MRHLFGVSFDPFDPSTPPLSVLEALEGPAALKICDPYGYIQDPPLCNKIQSIETASGKTLDHKLEFQLNGKLSVKLISGEELTGLRRNFNGVISTFSTNTP